MNEYKQAFGDARLTATDVGRFQTAIEQVHRLNVEVTRLQRENETLLRIIDRLSLKINKDAEGAYADEEAHN